jgi:NitT/TauT family transport system substrate-binding protein
VDIGWSVAPFVLDLLSTRAARMIARASDIAAIREQTIRVQITNASNLAAKKDVIARYMKAYNETVDWMYSSPEAVPRYLAFSGLAEPAVRLMLREFIPRESLQADRKNHGIGREHEGRGPVQVLVDAAQRNSAQGADPGLAGLVSARLFN